MTGVPWTHFVDNRLKSTGPHDTGLRSSILILYTNVKMLTLAISVLYLPETVKTQSDLHFLDAIASLGVFD